MEINATPPPDEQLSHAELRDKPFSLANALIGLGVLAVGIFALGYMVKTRPEPPKKPPVDSSPLVEVEAARKGTHPVSIRAQGTVVPARRVVVAPEVSGRIQWQNSALVAGGKLAKGTPLVRIDARDYQLAVRQQESAVDKAQTELVIERSRKKVAEREWELLGNDNNATASKSLALREPQLRTAQVALEAAKSGLEQAKLNVTRTSVRAPFNAFVTAESSEIGQLVGPTTQLATLVGTDHFWVQVSIPVENLARLAIPGVNAGEGAGTTALVSQAAGTQTIERTGRIVRLLGEVDPVGGMARLLVEIDDPLGLAKKDGSLPLLLGAFVDVRFDAGELDGVVLLPRSALHEGNKVYVEAEGTLSVRPVTIAWRLQDSVLIASGVEAGDQIIVSSIAEPVDGMKVRRADQAPPATQASDKTPGAGGKAPAPETAGAPAANAAATEDK